MADIFIDGLGLLTENVELIADPTYEGMIAIFNQIKKQAQ